MKSEFLKGLGLTDEQISAIMAENGKDIGREKAKLEAAETARDDYKTQLEEANKEIKGYKELDVEAIQAKAAEWEQKYKDGTKDLQDKLDALQYNHALEGYLNGYQFSNSLVKEAVINQLKAKAFKLEGDKLVGADEFMTKLKEENPSAFKDEKAQPTITLPGSKPGNPPSQNKLSLSEVMKMKNANPDLDITQYL